MTHTLTNTSKPATSLPKKTSSSMNSSNDNPTIPSRRSKSKRRTTSAAMSSFTVMTPGNGGAIKRIRTPHPHDVLSGRGGGINSHPGNRTFRDLVHERKNAYNLAGNKAEKARVAREVIDLVKGLTPPGRFLQKDHSASTSATGWWVEVDDTKAMAKTSQALREGAPMIRAAHKEELEAAKKPAARRNSRKRQPSFDSPENPNPQTYLPTTEVLATNTPPTAAPATQPTLEAQKLVRQPTSSPMLIAQADLVDTKLPRPNPTAKPTLEDSQITTETAIKTETPYASEATPYAPEGKKEDEMAPTLANEGPIEAYGRPLKRVRVDGGGATPTLLPTPAPDAEPFLTPVPRRSRGLQRVHSLALSDLSNDDLPSEDFVNPFENESDEYDFEEAGKEASNLVNDAARHPSFSVGTGLRPRGSIGNSSLRSFASELSDLPDVWTQRQHEDTMFDEGMKAVYDAANPGLTSPRSGDIIPTHLYPFRGRSSSFSPMNIYQAWRMNLQ